MDDSAVVSSAKGSAQFRVGQPQLLATEIHGHLPGQNQIRAASCAQNIIGPQIEPAGHFVQYFPAARQLFRPAGAHDVFQIRRGKGSAVHGGKGFHFQQQTLKQAKLCATLGQIQKLITPQGKLYFAQLREMILLVS